MGLVLFAAGVVYTVALAAVLITSQHDQRRPVDAIVVLGAAQYNGRPSPVLRARLDHAIVLYREGYAPMILVTGGVGRGDTTSEALAGQRYLVAHEVPQEAVVVQPVGRSTRTSMTAVGEWLGERGLRRVLLVSDPFHMFRLRLEARRTLLFERFLDRWKTLQRQAFRERLERALDDRAAETDSLQQSTDGQIESKATA